MKRTLPAFSLRPIGLIHTPFKDRADATRQPRAEARLGEGTIILNPSHNFKQALEDLDGFEFIWVISWFHKNKNWKPKVLPPRGSRKKRGVFATRSPYRPNPIGLSLARLILIEGRTIRIAETDLLDGTPILDLKPYLPDEEAFPDARAGWLSHSRSSENEFAVRWSEHARKQAQWLAENFQIELVPNAERVLTRDVAPHPYRRISKTDSGSLQLAIKSWRVEFAVSNHTVEILRIHSGYTLPALENSSKPLHDDKAHRAFHSLKPS